MRKIPADEFLSIALDEDRASRDITTPFFYSDADKLDCEIIAKGHGIFCGAEFVSQIWPVLNAPVVIDLLLSDGTRVAHGDCIARFLGPARAVLAGERTLLNFIQRLSGISTLTQAYVNALNAPHIQILDTRKTTPLWRDFEKYAVRIGGGHSHRRDLSDMVLIKENHLAMLKNDQNWQGITDVLHRIKSAHPQFKIEIEIDSLDLLKAVDLRDADIIMLDNFALADILPAVDWIRAQAYEAEIELSGGIALETINQYAPLPIQRISVGALTHSVPALDISMIMTPEKSR